MIRKIIFLNKVSSLLLHLGSCRGTPTFANLIGGLINIY